MGRKLSEDELLVGPGVPHHAASPTRKKSARRLPRFDRTANTNTSNNEFGLPTINATTVIHSLFRPSDLTERSRAIREAEAVQEPVSPDMVLEPATYDPLLNPEPEAPHTEGNVTLPPSAGRKNKIRWSKYLPWVWVVVMVFAICGFLPWGIYTLHQTDAATYVQAWFIAGVFVFIAVPISIFDVAQHMRHWYDPPLQKCIVRIIWMVPVYAIDSWLALRFVSISMYIGAARECYEAYVIYNFYLYLLIYLRKNPSFDASLEGRKPQKHLFPIQWLRPWTMGQEFMNECTKGVTSYIIIRPITTVAAFFLQLTDSYDEGELRYDRGYAYIALINSIAQGWAIYCLILFYLAFKEDLAPIKPLYKFLTIKAVVFLSFWQAVFIAFLAYIGVIKDDPRWQEYNKENVAIGLQNFLVCIEMFLASFVHHKVFSFMQHVRDKQWKMRLTLGQQMHHIFDVKDLKEQMIKTVKGEKNNTPQKEKEDPDDKEVTPLDPDRIGPLPALDATPSSTRRLAHASSTHSQADAAAREGDSPGAPAAGRRASAAFSSEPVVFDDPDDMDTKPMLPRTDD